MAFCEAPVPNHGELYPVFTMLWVAPQARARAAAEHNTAQAASLKCQLSLSKSINNRICSRLNAPPLVVVPWSPTFTFAV